MKKLLLLVVAVMFGLGTISAKSVDVNTARTLGQKFVQANFEQVNTTDLQLVTTVTSDNGDDCFYIFNVGENGFIIISASDNYYPILAYSEESNFDISNRHNGAMFMLDNYKMDIEKAIVTDVVASPEVSEKWAMLEKSGRLTSKRSEKVGPLCKTKWNQDSPYNLYAPVDAGGPGGRAYAGCVATAMSQVMKVWNAPAQGEGSHYYNWHGQQLGANFGNTTYHWDLMPITLSGATDEQIDAVATLMYHCGIAVNMGYSASGSGAFSDDVPNAMRNYFDYDYCVKKSRNSYQTDVWNQMLRDEFDLGRPVYYSGQSPEGGHAFVCDGYDENDLMHYNFGWSGSDDGWYLVDGIDYTGSAGAIFNYVPTNVYNNTVQAPSEFNVTRDSETSLSATLTWKNPTKTLTSVAISSIDAIVVERNGSVIATIDAPQIGANVTYVDENVPCYSTFTYSIYAMKDGVRGDYAEATEQFGPTTEWKVITTASAMQGWRGGSLKCYDAAGNMFAKVTMNNSTPGTAKINVPFGHKVSFVWKAGTGYTSSETMSIKIKNSENNVVYEYSGSPQDLTEGEVCNAINNAGQTPSCNAPANPSAVRVGDDIVVSWDGEVSGYGFNVYRDGILYALVQDNTFTDVAPEVGGYCYTVCTFCNDGESAYTEETCGTAGEGCDPASEIWYTVQANGKPIITWTAAPETTVELSGYYVYRKIGEDGEYQRAKIVGANKTEYKETKSMEDGTWYYYKVIAYYQDIDCASAPAKALFGSEFFVKYYYSLDAVEENEFESVSVYPNPAKDVLTVKAENLNNVTIYNSIGQKVFAEDLSSDECVVNLGDFEVGMYIVRVSANGNETIKKVTVIR